jgi:kanamycin kinase
VLEQGGDADGSWLVTEEVPGRSAVDPRWTAEPATAATAIGRGLRLLHDALPVDECPFDWSVERRLARAELRHPVRAEPPPIDRLVVCHGDACAPNTLLHDDGTFAAHVDLGSLGVADRWADLAVAAWSTEWNYGPGYDGFVYEGYGIAPDPRRIAYYRHLWDMT